MLDEGPNLDRAVLRARDLRRVRDRLVDVGAVEQVVPAELLLRLGERAVGDERLAVVVGASSPPATYLPASRISCEKAK
jgi:hypothetical protein